MQYTYNYVIERHLPDGSWARLGGMIIAPDEDTVRQKIEKMEKGREIRIISIEKRSK